MGTRGYRVYRWKGYYHVHYNHYDSYPDGLGVQVASEIPVGDEETYKKWLENIRAGLDEDVKQNKEQIDGDRDEYFITTEQPTNDLFIEWVYEIDLDHEVFLVDTNPLFALSSMPSSELFLQCIGVDSYGHRAYDPTTPEEHIYHWKSDPPQVEQSVIDAYATRHPNETGNLSISELLGGTDSLSDCETVRVAAHEVIIGRMLGVWEVGHWIRILETAHDRTDIPEILLPIGVNMVQVAIGPMLFGPGGPKHAPVEARSGNGFGWLASDVCMLITTHLDDERNKKKNTLELVDEIIARREPGRVSYGILFSFFHCTIVRVDPQNSFTSTAALQFLPSFYAPSPSTPGITAIARLGFHCPDRANTVADTIESTHFLHNVPVEVLEQITEHMGPSALQNLCVAVPLFKPAAQRVLSFPHVDNYRLVEVVQTKEEDEVDSLLSTKVFSATLDSVPGLQLTLGVGAAGKFPIAVGANKRSVPWKVSNP
ncbi:hypothetical protein C8R46DRAFT_988849 [Mycena filopes]|nr:hypothetical protein C8R46DRAFT_988849 [Mycena filopes]